MKLGSPICGRHLICEMNSDRFTLAHRDGKALIHLPQSLLGFE